jgi:Eco29kI restriction endonuclease
MAEPYNPLDKSNLGKSVVEALLLTPSTRLGEVRPFDGAGIYAIYYHGAFEPYQAIVTVDVQEVEKPIYVGKAVPSGPRKGASLATSGSGRWLFNRIAEHRDSIKAATNLNPDDFSVRYLAVDDIWIPLGEALLISMFNPVWNSLIEGFGNHDPGSGRYNGLRPIWDVLHPGRTWADKCKIRSETREEIGRQVIDYFVSLEKGSLK